MRIHDLLEVDAERFLQGLAEVSAWVCASLHETPYVVVRRGSWEGEGIPVGIRGSQRLERCAAFCRADVLKRVVTPEDLLSAAIPLARSRDVPALRSLTLLVHRWQGIGLPWGPAGSVGFELATGREVTRSQSDLDIVIYAECRLTAEKAKNLWEAAQGLPAAADIRVETPVCGFSLQEYAARTPEPILLRKTTAVTLGRDPWEMAEPR